MGARPPPGGDSSAPDTIEFGIAAVNARLSETEIGFPATTGEILRAVDDTAVPYDASGNTLDLAEALDRLQADRFESESDLLDRLHPVYEERRVAGAGSVIGRIRQLLPL